jgi:hypothetical protein
MSYSIQDRFKGCLAVMTRLPFFPLQVTDPPTQQTCGSVWNIDVQDALTDYTTMADIDLALFINGDKPPGKDDCKPPNYWSKNKDKCLRIPKCPKSTDTFDTTTEECVGGDTPEETCKKRKAAGEDVYWSKKYTTCLPIPPCDPGKHFDEEKEECVPDTPTPTPSGGGGGGGGGGSGGSPLLLVGIVGALALFAGR